MPGLPPDEQEKHTYQPCVGNGRIGITLGDASGACVIPLRDLTGNVEAINAHADEEAGCPDDAV